MFFEFPKDWKALEVEYQFMVGRGLLITPVLEDKATSVHGYFPTTSSWFNFYTGQNVLDEKKSTKKEIKTVPTAGGDDVTTLTADLYELTTPLDAINVHVRCGTVLPLQVRNNQDIYIYICDFVIVISLVIFLVEWFLFFFIQKLLLYPYYHTSIISPPLNIRMNSSMQMFHG